MEGHRYKPTPERPLPTHRGEGGASPSRAWARARPTCRAGPPSHAPSISESRYPGRAGPRRCCVVVVRASSCVRGAGHALDPFLDGQVRPSGRPSSPSPLLLTRPRAADLAPLRPGGVGKKQESRRARPPGVPRSETISAMYVPPCVCHVSRLSCWPTLETGIVVDPWQSPPEAVWGLIMKCGIRVCSDHSGPKAAMSDGMGAGSNERPVYRVGCRFGPERPQSGLTTRCRGLAARHPSEAPAAATARWPRVLLLDALPAVRARGLRARVGRAVPGAPVVPQDATRRGGS